MSEDRWEKGTNPGPMLRLIRNRKPDYRTTLFMLACCRSIPESVLPPSHRHALDVVEKYIAGDATDEDVLEAFPGVGNALNLQPPQLIAAAATGRIEEIQPLHDATRAIEALYTVDDLHAVGRCAELSLGAASPIGLKATLAIRRRQAAFLRCALGNPFRPVADVDHAWLVWNGGAVRHLAQDGCKDRPRLSDELEADRLPVLADALEEAGCTDAGILSHLRCPGPHLRGCWVVDLLLGRE